MLILEGISREVTRVAFSPDSSTVLASGDAGDEGMLTALWQLPGAAEPFHRLPGVTEALFTADGGSLVTLTPRPARTVSLARIDVATMAPVGAPRTVTSPAAAVADDWLGRTSGTPQSSMALHGLHLTLDQTRLVGVQGVHRLAWFSWPGLSPQPGWDGPPTWAPGAIALSPDGSAVAVFDTQGRVYLLDAGTGEVRWETLVYTHEAMVRIAYSPSGRHVAVASGSALRVLSGKSGEVIARLGQRDRFYRGLAFTPDGRLLATVSREGTVKLFDTATWRLAAEMAWRLGGLACVAFSADGMLAAAGSLTGKVVVWDVDL